MVLEPATLLRALPGIGPARAARLAALGLETAADVLFHAPRRREDLAPPRLVREFEPGIDATIVATVTWRRSSPLRAGGNGPAPLLRVGANDGTGSVEVLLFHREKLWPVFAPGKRFTFRGKVARRGRTWQLVATTFEAAPPAGSSAADAQTSRPVYPLPDGVPAALYRGLVARVVGELAPSLADWRDAAGLERDALAPLAAAIAALHDPAARIAGAAPIAPERARQRLAYEEFVRLLLPLLARRHEHAATKPHHGLELHAPATRLVDRLPFAPTAAQRRALAEILRDLERPAPMHRLLHGDVGSGKTAVALAALGAVAAAGRQAALLAPTEVLAHQHARAARALFADAGIESVLLTGRLPAAERRQAEAALAAGQPLVAIGTHALLGARVPLPRLAFAVVDEQHRFGVAQRLRLRDKNPAGGADLLVMTATPIPRSLALTLYGDLDVSVLDELPPHRKPVRTEVWNSGSGGGGAGDIGADARIVAAIRDECAAGGRAFVVCPLVAESLEQDVAAAERTARMLEQAFGGALQVALVHGRRGGDRNRTALDAFRRGTHPVLVATIVVEVGVDVPEASLMVVLDAQRFGLAALHQLRGRVGRGTRPSRCLLVARNRGAAKVRDDVVRRRMDVLAATNDGFRVAEEDLALRGAGDVYGLRQHGLPDFAFADVVRDLALLHRAREDARAIVAAGRAAEIQAMLPPLRSGGAADRQAPGPG